MLPTSPNGIKFGLCYSHKPPANRGIHGKTGPTWSCLTRIIHKIYKIMHLMNHISFDLRNKIVIYEWPHIVNFYKRKKMILNIFTLLEDISWVSHTTFNGLDNIFVPLRMTHSQFSLVGNLDATNWRLDTP